jgi:endonuclease III
MPRKSPRSRRRRTPEPGLPGKIRPRATPGGRRTHKRVSGAAAAPAARAGAGPAHAPRGARPRTGSAPRPKAKRPPAAKPRAKARLKPRATPRPASRAGAEPARLAALLGILERLYPDAATPLVHANALQLLIATILSAQCTDVRVNLVTPALFTRFPDAAAFAAADRSELEELIRSTGFYRNKAKAIQNCCTDLVANHGSEVPHTMEELTALPGVGRKTANVLLGSFFGIPGIVVDTHVQRLAWRLGLTQEQDPVRIEFALQPQVPPAKWSAFSLWVVFHGRRVCIARKPRCSICPLLPHCPRLGVESSQ